MQHRIPLPLPGTSATCILLLSCYDATASSIKPPSNAHAIVQHCGVSAGWDGVVRIAPLPHAQPQSACTHASSALDAAAPLPSPLLSLRAHEATAYAVAAWPAVLRSVVRRGAREPACSDTHVKGGREDVYAPLICASAAASAAHVSRGLGDWEDDGIDAVLRGGPFDDDAERPPHVAGMRLFSTEGSPSTWCAATAHQNVDAGYYDSGGGSSSGVAALAPSIFLASGAKDGVTNLWAAS